jgi:probable F420-dependent oxidoreductase
VNFTLELPIQRVEHPDEFLTGPAIAEVTAAAAAAGFGAVNVTDHPAPDTRWLDHGGHHALDPFVALSFAATADPDVRLQTNIYVAAYRNPFLGAKQVLSLQVLSGGRVILGVAAGYLRPEFDALGVDFDGRGARLDDALAVLDAAASGAEVVRDGPGYHARGVRYRPVPPGGRPPIWVGGNSRPAMRRAARFDGWAPFHTAGYAKASRTAVLEADADLAAGIAEVRSLAGDRAAATPFDVCWSEALLNAPDTSVDQRVERVRALAGLGVTWCNVSIAGTSRPEVLAGIAAFGRDVIGATSAV